MAFPVRRQSFGGILTGFECIAAMNSDLSPPVNKNFISSSSQKKVSRTLRTSFESDRCASVVRENRHESIPRLQIEGLKANLFDCSTPYNPRQAESKKDKIPFGDEYVKNACLFENDISFTGEMKSEPALSDSIESGKRSSFESDESESKRCRSNIRYDGLFVSPIFRNKPRLNHAIDNLSYPKDISTLSFDSRLERDYFKLYTLGSGCSGTTSLYLSRTDGCSYAIKYSRNLCSGSIMSCELLNEVRILSVLKHQNIVRYHHSWIESDRLLVVTEYCDGGSAHNMILHYRDQQIIPHYLIVADFISQISSALTYIHRKQIYHMDLKPENVLMQKNKMKTFKKITMEPNVFNTSPFSSPNRSTSSLSPSPECNRLVEKLREHMDDAILFGMNDLDLNYIKTVYKLCDFGHSFHKKINKDIDEGDSRYMPEESLIVEWPVGKNVNKIDIFSLGFCAIDMVRREGLPKEGTEWQQLRKNVLPTLPLPAEGNTIVASMCNKDPMMRPNAPEISNNEFLIRCMEQKAKLKAGLKKMKSLNQIPKMTAWDES